MFLHTHTHRDIVKSLERADVKLSALDYHGLFPSMFFPYSHFSCSPRVVSVVVQVSHLVSSMQCSAAESLIKMAGSNRIVLQSSTQCGSLSNVLSNHCLTVS